MITQLTGQDLPQWIIGARTAGLPGSPAGRVRRRVIT
jgi:hypothetical protein